MKFRYIMQRLGIHIATAIMAASVVMAGIPSMASANEMVVEAQSEEGTDTEGASESGDEGDEAEPQSAEDTDSGTSDAEDTGGQTESGTDATGEDAESGENGGTDSTESGTDTDSESSGTDSEGTDPSTESEGETTDSEGSGTDSEGTDSSTESKDDKTDSSEKKDDDKKTDSKDDKEKDSKDDKEKDKDKDKDKEDADKKTESDKEKAESKTDSTSSSSSSSGIVWGSSYTGVIRVVSTQTRTEMVKFATSYITELSGVPYVWGGESLTSGVDCSGFVGKVYEHFGISLPRTSREQAAAAKHIELEEAKPGDLLFKTTNGTVTHVMMVVENDVENRMFTVVEAKGQAWGIVIMQYGYDSMACAGRFIEDEGYTSTQASSLQAVGKRAYEGDTEAQKEIIEALAKSCQREWTEYGFTPSVLIAQAICECGWVSFPQGTDSIYPEMNNILGVNAELDQSYRGEWETPWDGNYVSRNVPQHVNGQVVMGYETMRAYKDIEECLEDYASWRITRHPELKYSTDYQTVVDVALKGYATSPTYQSTIISTIEKYDLTRFDDVTVIGEAETDGTNYSKEELELIWALVAQEDDSSYEGALAVITSVMNRADANYGGYGTTALDQLKAPGQYCYSESVSPSSLWEARLGGNVSDDVKQAVSDCLTKGIRNHQYKNFRSTDDGSRVQIGSNWYF